MRAVAIISLLLTTWVRAGEVDLQGIIAHPQRFDGQQIRTKGLAGDAGNGLYLFPDYATAAKSVRDARHAAYLPDIFGNFKGEENRCWFAVTGIVRSRRHGPWGENACEIEIKTIRKLYREKGVLWPKDFGVFRNATSTAVLVDSEVSSGGSTGLQISAKQAGELEIESDRIITFENWSKSGLPKPILFKARIQVPARTPQDPSERTFHFVIHRERLEARESSVRTTRIERK